MTPAICKSVTTFAMPDCDGADWLPIEAWEILPKIIPKSMIWTGRLNEQVVAICGITAVHPHLAEVWSYLHPDARAHRFWLHRSVKRILRVVVANSEFWRVQAVCYSTNLDAHVWLRRLGFQRESHMPFYGPKGELMTRYVWFPRGLLG
jgi:hypothetical protein